MVKNYNIYDYLEYCIACGIAFLTKYLLKKKDGEKNE